MASLHEHERRLYEDVWALPHYADHAPGEIYLPVLQEHCPAPATILDAGVGSGKGALALVRAGYIVTGCDLTPAGLVPEAATLPFVPACLWRDLGAQGVSGVDAVYCTDVLEHVPTQFTMLAVRHMLAIARRGVLISVSTHPDQFGAWVGRALHQTVQPFVWWRDALREIGRVRDARDLAGPAVFWVEPEEVA